MNAIFRVVTRIQDQDDFSGNLTDGEFLRYNSSTGKFQLQSVSPGGDSGQLQYNDNGTFAGVDHSSIGISGDIFKLSSLAIGDIPLVIKGYSGQTGNLTEWRNNSDSVLAKVDAGGNITVGAVTASGRITAGTGYYHASTAYSIITQGASGNGVTMTDVGLYPTQSFGGSFYDNSMTLGRSDARWSHIYGVNITASGQIITPNTYIDFTSPTTPSTLWRMDHSIPGYGSRLSALYNGSITTSLVGRTDAMGVEFNASYGDAFVGSTAIGSGDSTRNGLKFKSLGNGGGVTLIASNNSGVMNPILRFGGTTSSYPAIKRSSAAIALRLADDSADAALTCGAITASGLLNLQNSTTPTEFNLHNTYTSATSREYLKMLAVTGAAYQIGSAIGSAGGTNRDIDFGHWNAAGTFTTALKIYTDGTLSNTRGLGACEFFGRYSGFNASNSGTNNTGFGGWSLGSNTTGSSNTALGYYTLANNSTGAGNVAVGLQALGWNTSGDANTAVGNFSLSGNTTGRYNSAFGSSAGVSITNGWYNTAVGFQSLQYNTTGYFNVVVGANGLGTNSTGSRNTVIGYQSLYANTSGSGNVTIGYFAGAFETGSDTFYVDNQSRTNTAGDKAGALLYGTFNATPANQTLKINATTTIAGDLLFTDATYDIGKSGATRPRDGFFSRNIDAVGTVISSANGVNGGVKLFPSADGSVSGGAIGFHHGGYDNGGFRYYQGEFSFSSIPNWSTTPSSWTPSIRLSAYPGQDTVFNDTAANINFRVEGVSVPNALFVQGSNGNVGIGNSTPATNLEIRNSTNAQTFRLAETWTSSTSFGALQFKANAGAAYQIGSAVGSAGGTNRAIDFGHWNAAGTFTSAYTVNTDGSSSVGFNAFYAGRIHGPYTDQILVITTGSAGTGGDSGSSLVFGTASTGARQFRFKYNTTQVMGLSETQGNLSLTPIAAASGSPTVFTVTCPAHTTLTTAEVTDGYFNATRTVNFGATGGTVASQRTWRFTAPTFTAAAATTFTTASTVSISGPPVASTNVAVTTPLALHVESGKSYFSDHLWLPSGKYIGHPSGYGFGVSQTGGMVLPTIYYAGSPFFEFGGGIFQATQALGIGPTMGGYAATGADTLWYRDAAGIFAQRNTTAAQTLRVYNTYTSLTSGEYGELRWTSNVLYIGSNKGSAGGSARDLAITHGGTVVANFLADRFYLGPIADSTATGGNARGQYAVDLQLVRSAAGQVASGTSSFVSGQYNLVSGAYSAALGYTNTVSGGGSFAAGYVNVITGNWNGAIGYANTITGGDSGGCFATGKSNSINVSNNYTAFVAGYLSSVTSHAGFAHGIYASSTRYNQYTHGGDFFLAALGGAQYVRLLVGKKTTDATPTTLMLDGSSARLTIPSGKTMSCKVTVKGIKSDGSAKARFVRLVEITNVGGTTALDMSPEAIGTDYNPSGCVCDITADNTNDALDISVTGITGETWRWVAVVEGLEIAYGT